MTGNTRELDDLFAMARDAAPRPSASLMARVLDDALAHQPEPAPALLRQAPRRSLWAVLSTAFGGAVGFAGLASATLAGLWIGFAQPAPVSGLTGALWSDTPMDSVELMPSFEQWMAEG
jgi:hypothetical protein